MLKVRPLEEVMEEFPEFQPNWKTLGYGGMENPAFGKVEHIVVCKEDGTPIFDQYKITETPGSIIVPYDIKEGAVRVGMVTQERYIPGKTYVELPRGWGKDSEDELEMSFRKVLDETGHVPASLAVLARSNFNTAFYTTEQPIVIAQFQRLEEISNPNGDNLIEKISKIAPYSFRDLQELRQEGGLIDGVSGHALTEFGFVIPEFYKTAVKPSSSKKQYQAQEGTQP